jgi:hypothetical protein
MTATATTTAAVVAARVDVGSCSLAGSCHLLPEELSGEFRLLSRTSQSLIQSKNDEDERGEQQPRRGSPPRKKVRVGREEEEGQASAEEIRREAIEVGMGSRRRRRGVPAHGGGEGRDRDRVFFHRRAVVFFVIGRGGGRQRRRRWSSSRRGAKTRATGHDDENQKDDDWYDDCSDEDEVVFVSSSRVEGMGGRGVGSRYSGRLRGGRDDLSSPRRLSTERTRRRRQGPRSDGDIAVDDRREFGPKFGGADVGSEHGSIHVQDEVGRESDEVRRGDDDERVRRIRATKATR